MHFVHWTFSTRTANLLFVYGVASKEGVLKIDLEDFSLRRNVGKKTVDEVRIWIEAEKDGAK